MRAMSAPAIPSAETLIPKLESLFSGVDWAGLQEAVPDLSQCGDFLSLVGVWVCFVVYARWGSSLSACS